MQTLIAAYKVLSDDLERKRYDDLHSDGPQPQQSNNGEACHACMHMLARCPSEISSTLV